MAAHPERSAGSALTPGLMKIRAAITSRRVIWLASHPPTRSIQHIARDRVSQIGALRAGGSIRLFEQNPRTDLESLRNPLDIVDRNVALSPFNAPVIGTIHFDLVREVLLAQAARQTEPADIRRQYTP